MQPGAGAMEDRLPPVPGLLDGSSSRHQSAPRDLPSRGHGSLTGRHDAATIAAPDPLVEMARSNDVSVPAAGRAPLLSRPSPTQIRDQSYKEMVDHVYQWSSGLRCAA